MEDLKPKPTNQKKKPLNTLISALNANIKQIRPISHSSVSNTPNEVAIPFPPLNP